MRANPRATVGIAAVVTFIQQIIDSDGIFTREALYTAITLLLIQLLSHHQVWKPLFELKGYPAPATGIGQATPPSHPEP